MTFLLSKCMQSLTLVIPPCPQLLWFEPPSSLIWIIAMAPKRSSCLYPCCLLCSETCHDFSYHSEETTTLMLWIQGPTWSGAVSHCSHFLVFSHLLTKFQTHRPPWVLQVSYAAHLPFDPPKPLFTFLFSTLCPKREASHFNRSSTAPWTLLA